MLLESATVGTLHTAQLNEQTDHLVALAIGYNAPAEV